MHELFKSIKPTDAVAFTIVVGSLFYFFFAGSGIFHAPESLQTQITQGLFGLDMAIAGYYYGASKKDKPTVSINDNATGNITENK